MNGQSSINDHIAEAIRATDPRLKSSTNDKPHQAKTGRGIPKLDPTKPRPCEFARWAKSKVWKCELSKHGNYCSVTELGIGCPHGKIDHIAYWEVAENVG